MLENERPLSFAANVKRGVAATAGELVLVSNPDAVPRRARSRAGRVRRAHPRAGLVGPLVFWPDGTWQPCLRRFPTVSARSGAVRRSDCSRPYEHQVSHYGTARRARAGRLAARRRLPADAALDARGVGGWDGGFRHYVEDIDVAYRAAKAGWDAGSSRRCRPPRLRRRDRQALPRPPHALAPRGMARFLRKHPERLLALR